MRVFIKNQKFSSIDEIMAVMRENFKYVLQEIMECELSGKLCCEKSERSSKHDCSNQQKNYRNRYSK